MPDDRLLRAQGHARVYVPTHFGADGSREVEARCRCGWRQRLRFGRQRDAVSYYRAHLEEDVLGQHDEGTRE